MGEVKIKEIEQLCKTFGITKKAVIDVSFNIKDLKCMH